MQTFLYSECGLKGLSGISNDVRELQASDRTGREACAWSTFVYRIGLHAGMLAAALGGLDAFVFTAGDWREVGDRARTRLPSSLAWLGADLDPAANEAGKTVISRNRRVGSPLLVVPTDEELMIARHTLAVLSPDAARRKPPEEDRMSYSCRQGRPCSKASGA